MAVDGDEGLVDPEMTITEHLEELRWRILKSLAAVFIGTAAVWSRSGEALSWLAKPVGSLVFVAPTEAFFTRLKVAMFAGAMLALPFVLYQAWAFTACALPRGARKAVALIVPASYVFFVSGVCLAVFVVVPTAVGFLISYGSTAVTPMLSVASYIEFVVGLSIAFGIVFQLPLVLIFLHRAGLVGRASLAAKRRYIYFAAFVVAAVMTPGPDVFSQFALAIPIILLFEASLLAMRWTGER